MLEISYVSICSGTDLPAPIIVISNVSVLLTVVAMNSGALEATTSPPRTRYPRMKMGTGKVLSQEVAGTAGKTIADAAITDATTGSFDSQFMNMSKTGVSD
jgi:hypothetical protein